MAIRAPDGAKKAPSMIITLNNLKNTAMFSNLMVQWTIVRYGLLLIVANFVARNAENLIVKEG